jgi:hypothetical protein
MADQSIPFPFGADTAMRWPWFRQEPAAETSLPCPVQAQADALDLAVGVLGEVLDAMTVRLASLHVSTNGSANGSRHG